MAIEILENTLLKLLVRRGTNLERKEITLDEGEIGYSTDTQRLFIGDGTTAGGNIIGNKFLGTATTITDNTGVVNDLAFDSDNNTLQFISENDGSLLSDWSTVANLASAGNTTIVVDDAQRITVGTLSAGNFDLNALGSSLEIVSDKIALSGTINIDSITQRTLDATSYLNLPSKLKINSINYDWPSFAPSTNNSQLISNADNELSWALPTVIQTLVPTSTASSIPVGSIVPYVSAADMVPYGWLKCDGSTVDGWNDYPDLSGVIGNRYGGTGSNMVLPDLDRATVYGSILNDPYDDTRYNILTGLEPGNSSLSAIAGGTLSASPLSAFPMTFIIKSVNDIQTPPTISFNTPLSASLNGVRIDNTATQFLSGTIEVGLSSNNDGWVANSNATIYKNVYIGTPVNILDSGTVLVPTPWTAVDVPGSVPTSAKVLHLQYRIARRAAFYVTYDGVAVDAGTTPAATSNKYILGDAGAGSSKDTNGTSGQTTTRFDRNNRKIYFALDNSRSLRGAQPNITIDIIGWGE